MSYPFNKECFEVLFSDLKANQAIAEQHSDKLKILASQLAEMDSLAPSGLPYSVENIDLISEVEEILVRLMLAAEKKQVSFQLHLSTVPVYVQADRVYLQLLFLKTVSQLLTVVKAGTVISIHVSANDGNVLVESICHANLDISKKESDYFKKHRITNVIQVPSKDPESGLSVYRLLAEDMGGVMVYDFSNKNKGSYFSLKFALI